ncbi:MAG TPA: hypothetical protein PLI06_01945 [Methanofastidiosum sp.]|nr:hypothetical protein [Methanofastidiosum sp.]
MDKKKFDYHSLFVVGLIIFIPAGVSLLLMNSIAGYGLIGLGAIWAIVGYFNKEIGNNKLNVNISGKTKVD